MRLILILALLFLNGCITASLAVRQPAGQRSNPEVEARVELVQR